MAGGRHAGDSRIGRRPLTLARDHGSGSGVHPGVPDLPGFGRRVLAATPKQVYAGVLDRAAGVSGGAQGSAERPRSALYPCLATRSESSVHHPLPLPEAA